MNFSNPCYTRGDATFNTVTIVKWSATMGLKGWFHAG
jgi:hypothetical protein